MPEEGRVKAKELTMLKPEDYFDLTKTKFPDIFDGVEYVWDALKRLPEYVQSHLKPGAHGEVKPGAYVEDNVFIGKGTVVEPGAVIKGPAIIGEDCEIRKGAYVRGNVIVGDGAVVGNSCELKVAFLFDGANVPHFAYVGDSILGWKTHLGAGVKISNVKLIREPIVVTVGGVKYNTGLIKFGAIIGDRCDIGCNSVLNPGSMIGPNTVMYTNVMWRGVCPPSSVVKLRQTVEVVPRRSNAGQDAP